jgi:hypothetical protein
MNRLISVLVAALTLAGCAGPGVKTEYLNGPPTRWRAWIEQEGVRHPLPGTVNLKKAPFEIHVTGDDEKYSYGYAASVGKEELPPLDRMPLVFRVGNGLLVDEPNTKIAVSDAGVMRKQQSAWNMWTYQPPEQRRYISGFQKRLKNREGRVEYVRRIDTLCVDDGMKDTCEPIARSRIGAVYGMMAGVLVGERTTFFEPAYVNLVFVK